MSRADKLLALIVVAAVAAAIYAAVLRWRVEMPNRGVALILDLQEVEELAAASGVAVVPALERLRAAGATEVALSEQHLSDLVAAGEVAVWPASAAGLSDFAPMTGTLLSGYDAATAERLRAYLRGKLAAGVVTSPLNGTTPSPVMIPCTATVGYLEKVGLGWPVDSPSVVASAGLGVVARLDNYPGVSPRAITFMVAQAAAAEAELVIFSGDQVLGYPGLIEKTAQALRAGGVNYGAVELAGQLGETRLGLALEGDIVRVHSITEGEMSTLSPAVAIARYLRAVRERGIRACYVHLFLAPRQQPMRFNLDYVAALKRELQAAGYRVGTARPLAPAGVPGWLVMLMAAGAVAATVFALGRMVPLPQWVSYLLFIAGVGAGAGLFAVAPHLLLAEKALLAAITFPSIALIAVARGARTARAPSDVTPGALAARAGAWLIGASLICLGGGLVVAGLLSERLYMTKVLQFTGVKLALAAPLLVAGAVWTLRLHRNGDWPEYRRRVQENFRQAWNRPIYVWEALLAAGLLAAVAVMLMRSGNQPLVEVSGLETRVRGLLEQVFFARPRTKEFLIGHPALMLAVAMALRRRTRWVLVLLLLGAVGQVSLVNTFCHLHTPLLISLVRTAHGLWLGLAIGSAVVWVWDKLRSGSAEMSGQPTSGS